MKPEEIKITDLERILVGEVPGFFYVELIIRVFIVYLILLVSMRLMGKRMPSRLSRNEMAAIVSLAAAIGIPMMNPDRGIIPPFIVAAVLISYQTFISKRSFKHEKFETFVLGNLSTLISDGVINLKAMKESRISRERLFAQLRSFELLHLGEIKRFYLEAPGSFTLIRNEERQPGLTILPRWDTEFIEKQAHQPIYTCHICGTLADSITLEQPCHNCKSKNWEHAVK
jgi:uncharacterized membrane protein YcaP (DUF421 family)